MTPKPAVGRICHYVSHGSPVREDGTQAYTPQCRAAVIAEVGAWLDTRVPDYGDIDSDGRMTRHVIQTRYDDACSLVVLNPTGAFFGAGELGACLHDETTKAGGTWHWPERV
jgi:hypothetical protein